MPRYARLASQLLARTDRSNAASGPDPETRRRAIEAVSQALGARARARKLRRGAASLLAVAAAIVLVFTGVRYARRPVAPIVAAQQVADAAQVVAYSVSGSSSVVVSGAQAPLTAGRSLPAGSRLVTPPGGRAVLSFLTGTTVVVGEGTDVTVATAGASQILRLDAGWIDLRVAKLAAGQRFLVETADTEVEVHGTRFRVDLAALDAPCAVGMRTGVRVTEGVVTVRRGGSEARLTAGDAAPDGCTTPAAGSSGTAVLRPAAAGAAPSVSTLREQNDLFAGAEAARRLGDPGAALAALDRFLAVYPRSPLLESVVIERVRVLRAMASPRAAATAKDYLSRYPSGFARAEAEAIAAGQP